METPLRYRHFAKEVLKLSFYLILGTGTLYFFEFFTPLEAISWLSILVFMFFHLGSGYYICRSIGKPVFAPVYLGFMGFEFLGTIFFIFTWNYLVKPTDQTYLIPILIAFAVYKIYTSVMILRAAGKS